MKNTFDLSIGQRLAIGFGIVFAIIAAAFAIFYSWHASSAQAQQVYSERIAPLLSETAQLERATYRLAIAVRAVMIEPTEERAQAFWQDLEGARAALNALAGSEMESDGAQIFAQISPAAENYFDAAANIVRHRLAGDVSVEEEVALTAVRNVLFSRTAQFATLQEQKAEAALQQIATARERISQGLGVVALATGAILFVLAWITAGSIRKPARRLVRVAGALESGDWKPALELAPREGEAAASNDEMRRLANAFGSAAVALERREQRMLADGRIARAIGSTLESDELAESVLAEIVKFVRGEIGVFYAATKNDQKLIPIATYALDRTLSTIAFGEGIPGEAARTGQLITVADIPRESGFRIRLGYDESPPKAIAAVPLSFQGQVLGVVVVGSLRNFEAAEIAFLESAAHQLGVGLHNVRSHEEIQTLLEEVRASNERIQAQNEELQVQNEEIQAQSQQLQVQQEEMQAQNEELLQQSEELRNHATTLAEADDRKNKFLGVLAHELRNPLAPIVNSIFILKRTSSSSEHAIRAREVLDRQVQHLVKLVDDLLDVTRISQGKIQLTFERLDLVEVTRTCVEDLAAGFDQAGIALEVDLPNAPVEIDGDRTRLCQVLGNLLSNSMKFSDRGGRALVTLRVDHNAGHAVLRVTDSGIGLDPDLKLRLFQPFSQGAMGLARTTGGLGLGLALVKALVEMHGGTVEAHSDGPGRGAEFTVRIPLVSPASALQREHRAERASTTPASSASPPARILIIEDNVDAARTLGAALELDGHTVEIAHTGSDGIDKARALRPEIVLCDIGLPEMDGYSVARELRRLDQNAALVALTGYAAATDKEEARNAGFDLHLAKPLNVGTLTKIIEDLRRARPETGVHAPAEPGRES